MKSLEQRQKVNIYVIYGDIVLQKRCGTKFHFLHAHSQCMSDLCSRFQTSALDTVGGIAETQTVLH